MTPSLLQRHLGRLAIGAGALILASCGATDTATPVATVEFSSSRTQVALGSPVDLTYRFTLAAGASIAGDYRVFVHVTDQDGTVLWTDDHDPAEPTSAWQPGRPVEYTRTRFVPVFPHIGDANVLIGLHRGAERLPLAGGEADGGARAYQVGRLQLLPQSENIFVIYKSGWHMAEFAPADPAREWQWTDKSAVLSMRNPRQDVILFLEYDARPDVFADGPQQITLFSGEQPVATFEATSDVPVLLRLPIAAAALGTADMVELRLEADRTFSPSELEENSVDERQLGIRVYHAFVDSR